MKVFELLPRPLGNIFRKLTHFTCNSPAANAAGTQTARIGESPRSDLEQVAGAVLAKNIQPNVVPPDRRKRVRH